MSDLPAPRRSLFGVLRSSFLTGLIVVLPLGLTAYVVWAAIGWIDAWILPLIPHYWQPETVVQRWFGPEASFPLRGVGVLVFVLFTALIGAMTRGLIGRSIMRSTENMVDRVPLVRSVYSGLKQVTETFFGNKEKTFDRTCLVQFPREGTWAVGMVSSSPKGEIVAKLPQGDQPGDELIAVFVGLTPLTSGFLIYVPMREVIFLDMKADDAMKLIVSAGLVYPQGRVN